jgi:hypothetical protein
MEVNLDHFKQRGQPARIADRGQLAQVGLQLLLVPRTLEVSKPDFHLSPFLFPERC